MNDETKKRRGNIITITFLLAIITILYVTILDHVSGLVVQIIAGIIYFVLVFIAIRVQNREINKLIETRQMEDAKKVAWRMVKVFISYIDEGKEVKGTFDLIEQKENYVKIMSNGNKLTIPYHKINKLKEKIERRQ